MKIRETDKKTKIQKIIHDLNKLADPEKAKLFLRFFKTGKGEYGEGDRFLGVTVPNTRLIAKKYKNIPMGDLQELLSSKIHELRLCALMILRFQYESSFANLPAGKAGASKGKQDKFRIVNFYLKNTKYINNWDLVDLSASYIIGNWLLDRDRGLLYRLVRSKSLWERRIAVISTFEFIKNNQFEDSLKISEILLNDKHDLIHKAVGWMLRELGKRDQKLEEDFLKKHYKKMPRTMLRYAIEKFSKEKRDYYLKLT